MPRNENGTRIRGWILKNMRIRPVLDMKICYHDDRYSVEVQIPSLFEDNTASWVRLVNGVDTYVTESMLSKEEGDMDSGFPIAKARRRQKPTVTVTLVSIPVRERRWTNICDTTITRSTVFWRVKSHDPIATTWSNSPSTDWRSNPVHWHHRRVQEDQVRWCFAMVTWRLDINSGKKRWSEERNSIMRESKFSPINSCTFEQIKDIQEKMLLILRCKTMSCYRKDLPKTSTTSGTGVKWNP